MRQPSLLPHPHEAVIPLTPSRGSHLPSHTLTKQPPLLSHSRGSHLSSHTLKAATSPLTLTRQPPLLSPPQGSHLSSYPPEAATSPLTPSRGSHLYHHSQKRQPSITPHHHTHMWQQSLHPYKVLTHLSHLLASFTLPCSNTVCL